MDDLKDIFGEPIHTYTSNEAVQDGILFKISDLKPFKNSIINLITTNLLNEGYCQETEQGLKINLSNLQDLLTQAIKYMLKKPQDTFYDLKIELPSGKKQTIYICQNETSKYTAMLPEDY